jgi:hypothetical protein
MRSHWVSCDTSGGAPHHADGPVLFFVTDTDISHSSGPAGHTAAIYAARADLKRESSTIAHVYSSANNAQPSCTRASWLSALPQVVN